jgi:Ser/Thr protein kinase RdoA (MazF antagonist)
MALRGEEVVRSVAARFAVPGELLAVAPFGSGHINDSYRLTYRPAQSGRSGLGRGSTDRDERAQRYLLQRINTAVFRRPAKLMENIQRVTVHIVRRLRSQGLPDVERRVLTLIPARDGAPFCRDEGGGWWRLYRLLEGTHTFEAVKTPAHAEAAGRAYGEFQGLLIDLPSPRLHETIPNFHNTPLRYAALERAIAVNVARRVTQAKPEIDFLMDRRQLAGALVDLQRAGKIPERIVHNDAKISNVLMDAGTGAALCVVDLDTVMPGLSLYDFGDMVRSMTCTAAEDESDLTKVAVQVRLFEALVRGYLGVARTFLSATEVAQLVTAGKLITLEQGVRFLTDYLRGDTYYKTHRPGHNLDRTRTQLKLVESIERNEPALREIVASC